MNRPPRKLLNLAILLTLFLLAALIWSKLQKFEETVEKTTVASKANIENVAFADRRRREVRQSSASERQKSASRETIERLKSRWLALGSGNTNLLQRGDLAKETVNELLCSEELIELSRFLIDRGISVGNMFKLEDGVRDVFKTDKASLARDLLVKMAANGKFASTIEDWSLYAGESCPVVEFDGFHEALAGSSRMAASMALLGRNNQYVKENPEIAIESSLEVLKETPLAPIYIKRQINDIPDSVDFSKVLELLDNYEEVPAKVTDGVRKSIFERWARQDAHTAASYAISHPGEISPDVLTEIARLGVGGVVDDLEWIQSLPKGSYRDAAAQGAIWKYSMEHLEDAGKFVGTIDDPGLRKQEQESLESKRKSIPNSDEGG